MTAPGYARGVERDPALAYVGAVVPDRPEFRTAAFSRGGNMFQESLLHGLSQAGLPPDAVYSVEVLPSFPRSSRLLVRGQEVSLADGTPVRLMPFLNLTPLKQLGMGLFAAWNVLRWAWSRRGRPRVLCVYNLTVPPGIFVWTAARLSGSQVVGLICDIEVPGQTAPDTLWRRMDYRLQRWLIPRLDAAVVVADAITDDFARGIPTLLMEGGLRPEVLERASRRVGRDDGRITIGVACRLDQTNGVDTILQAFSLLDERFSLRIAGHGPLEAEVRRAAAHDPRIEYLGFVNLEEVMDLYASSDVLVAMRPTHDLNTRYFFPGKVLEYLASGAPVVTTGTGNVEKEFAEFVFLLRDESPSGLAAMLEDVARTPLSEREGRGAAGRAYVSAHKTWAVQAARVADFLREISSAGGMPDAGRRPG